MEKTTAIAACGGGGGGGGGDDPDASLLLLPEDFLIEILVRLPAVSLLRFKSVCKSWRDLIQTSFFIDLHSTFNSSSSSSNFGTFILRTNKSHPSEDGILMLSGYEHESKYGDGYRCTDGSWYKFTGGDGVSDDDYDYEQDVSDDYMLGFKDYDNDDNQEKVFKADDVDDDQDEVFKDAAADNDDQLLLKFTNFELPSGYELTWSKDIAGSCNGLICLHDFKLGDVSLWNPATRQFRTLPKSTTIEIDDDDFVQFGNDFVAFGFDVKTKDYKVLLITNIHSKSGPPWPLKVFCRAQVYSLSTDSWRLLEGINSPLDQPAAEHHGPYLNGNCFFIASVYHPETNTYNMCIQSFDFTKEIFTTMQLPPDHDRRQRLFLRCLGGEKMALFTTLRMTSSDEYDSDCTNDSYGYEDCDIYEYTGCGLNKESWTKLHSFQIKNNRSGEPICISNNGKFAFLDTTERSYHKNVRLYNLVTNEVKV